MDEPCSALDPIATGKIEDLIEELKGEYSILIVTHNMQQAARTSDYTAFMYLGRLVEYGPTDDALPEAAPQGDRGLRHRPLRLSVTAGRPGRPSRPRAQGARAGSGLGGPSAAARYGPTPATSGPRPART